MSHLANFFIPTPRNNYRAYLLSNRALAIYCLILILANLVWGNLGIQKAFALFSESQVLSLHNQERLKHGLPALSYNTTLAESAKAKGAVMLENNCWSHYCPPGKSPWDFFQAAGYVYSYAGENLAEGFDNVEAMMQAWMNSKTHRENILKSEFTEMGIAIIIGDYQGVKNNIIVVVHFGHPRINSKLKVNPTDSNLPVTIEGVSLLAPEEGQLLNTNQPNVLGRAQDPIYVGFNGKTVSGSILPDGGIFSYQPELPLPDGGNTVTISKVENPTNPLINRQFTIDTLPPKVAISNVSLNGIVDNGNSLAYRFIYTSPEDISNLLLVLPTTAIQVVKLAPNKYSFDFPSTSTKQGLQFSVYDPAGNLETLGISSAELEDIINSSDQKNFLIPTGGVFTTESLFKDISEMVNTPVKAVTTSIVLLLAILFFLDFLTIRRYNQKYKLQIQSQSHLHLPTFIILLMLILMGNFTGKV